MVGEQQRAMDLVFFEAVHLTDVPLNMTVTHGECKEVTPTHHVESVGGSVHHGTTLRTAWMVKKNVLVEW